MSDAISTLRPGIAAFVAGTLSALLFVAVLSNSLGGMILFGMAQLPLYLVALSLGPGFAAAAAVWAFGVLVPSVSLVGALGFLVWAAIPVLAVTATALRSQRPNPGLLVLALTGIVITAFIAADVVNAGVSGGLEARIRGWMAPMLMHGASKAAIRNFARSWIQDLAPRHIRVNVVVPGPVGTPGLLGLVPEEHKSGFVATLEAQVPLGRMGTPDEIANAALFLASDESSYVNGSELFVDGGVAQV